MVHHALDIHCITKCYCQSLCSYMGKTRLVITQASNNSEHEWGGNSLISTTTQADSCLCAMCHNSVQSAGLMKQDVSYFWTQCLLQSIILPANHLCCNKLCKTCFQNKAVQKKTEFNLLMRKLCENGSVCNQKYNNTKQQHTGKHEAQFTAVH